LVNMQVPSSLRLTPLKLHTKTTILISAVLVAVFALIAYFYDLYTTRIGNDRERQQALLLARKVADSVEHHVKILRKSREHGTDEEEFEPDWTLVQDELNDTVLKDGQQQLAEVRIFSLGQSGSWEEKVRLPEDSGPPFIRPPIRQERRENPHHDSAEAAVSVGEQGQTRLVSATAEATTPTPSGNKPVAAVTVLLAFDENQSVAARLRRLIWPLMFLAIVSITLITYLLFRHIIYRPISNLLYAMSKAEEGDLGAEVQPSAPDEIGLLTSRFNRMLGRVRGMTEQLNLQQRRLESRVHDATAEIAERKEQLEEANLELFEMQRQLTQFERLAAAGQLAAQFAHEVGTPLNLISGHVQLLRARTTEERVIKRLDIIAGQIERITSIVRSMLDSTRKPKPQFERIDVNLMLARILDAAQPTLAARGVELNTRMTEALPFVDADPDQFQQVLINLINNSLDAMPDGGTLHVASSDRDGFVDIELGDTGQGIAGDQIDLIFDPLFTTKHDSGTGLGLTIVKQIIAEHHGSVDVESELGRGTVFHIRLPMPDATITPELIGAGGGQRQAAEMDK
jgi:two-component system NtrC family sensor kinase